MMYRTIPAPVVAAILAVDALLAGWMGYLRPERLGFYVFAGAFLPSAWGLLALASARRVRDERCADAGTDPYSGALAVGGVLVGVGLGTGVATTLGAMEDATAERLVGLAIGALLVVTGNAMPKMLTPLSQLRCDPARVQSLERFAGWSFVIAGGLYGLLWLALEPERAALWSTLALAACVALVSARVLALIVRGRRSPPMEREPTSGRPSG